MQTLADFVGQSQGPISATATAVSANLDRIIRATDFARIASILSRSRARCRPEPRSHRLDQRLLRGALRHCAARQARLDEVAPPRRRVPQWCIVATPAFSALDSSIVRRQTFDTLVTVATIVLRDKRAPDPPLEAVSEWMDQRTPRTSDSGVSDSAPTSSQMPNLRFATGLFDRRPFEPRSRGPSRGRLGPYPR
jgi:hypothetical protein